MEYSLFNKESNKAYRDLLVCYNKINNMSVKVEWKGDSNFVGYDSKGNTVSLGRNAIAPMEMLLISLAGCTAIDVVEILTKMRKNVKELNVLVSGERNEDYPRYWKKVKIEYIIKGSGLSNDDVEKAIKLSMNVYCSVAATISGKAEISYSYKLEQV